MGITSPGARVEPQPPADAGPYGDGVSPSEVRSAVRRWLADHWDPGLSLQQWREQLVDAGWARPTWDSSRCGRSLPEWADAIVAEELTAIDAVGNPVDRAVVLAVTTIGEHGTPEMIRRFVRPALTGEEVWCQLFSEPGAGSDLAAVRTSAAFDGDCWSVSGQKLWSTSADHARYGLLLARTDWDQPKHAGLTMFALPMKQPGIEIRAIRQMNEHSSFNEVFMNDARIPADHVIGGVGAGWAVAMTTLAAERGVGTLVRPAFPQHAGRAVSEAAAEADRYFEIYGWYPQRSGRVDLLRQVSEQAAGTLDPVRRQAVTRVLSLERVHRWTADRVDASRALGNGPGPEGSIGKLLLSRIAREAAAAHTLIAGPAAMLTGPDTPLAGLLGEILTSVPAQSIAGGTDEVQRNIIGERVLGLPREPKTDLHQPYRTVRRGP